MVDYKASYTDITNWDINKYIGTGGTRSKEIVMHPDTEKQYFFKASKIDKYDQIKYPTEFWSEIVSSKIGQALGFDMLDYNIAYNSNNRQQVGCISESMVEYAENKLTEGITYLRGCDPQYNPENKEDQKKYTFQFICDTLIEFNLEKYIIHIIEIIVFDSIIGNSDRHQENWGTITYFKIALEKIESELNFGKNNFLQKIIKKISKIATEAYMNMSDKQKVEKPEILKAQNVIAPSSFSPIYDSGCCLAREKEDNKIFEMLKNNQMIEAYIKNGSSEIRWCGRDKKINHFDLVSLVMVNFEPEVKKIISRVKEKYNNEIIKNIIENIDSELPDMLKAFKLSAQRKELMYKLITLRLEKLFILVK
ncbi:MAG: hypothetical protein JKX79_09685 [Labilibaculum sp.]|nr:hypothetical protein [Labilibaculum sp.]